MNGTGIYTSANGTVFDGKWKDGKRDGNATIVVNSIKYSGNCQGNIMAENESTFMVMSDFPIVNILI